MSIMGALRAKIAYMKRDVSSIKDDMRKMLGESMSVTLNSSRGKKTLHSGKLRGVYPHIFVIDSKDEMRSVAVSYTDILTDRASVVIK